LLKVNELRTTKLQFLKYTMLLPLYGLKTSDPSIQEIFHGLGTWRIWLRRGGCRGSWWGSRKEGDHWGDLGADGWIILGWIFRRRDVGIWTGLGWPRIETGGGRL